MPNRLSKENSPYLLQHAHNPVEWYPWGEEAFQEARVRDVPVFLSIGYAACHWCHVMEHESFEDADTARMLNDNFVSIKVDREERPDVDAIYMQAVTAITGQGGWPLSVFLTPEGEPFYGGTYFPPQRRYNMPSFREVLTFIHQRWNQDRKSLLKSGQQLTTHISQTLALQSSDALPKPEIMGLAAEQLWKDYDWEYGGWGSAPKFPSASTIEFLLSKDARDHDPLALDMAKDVLFKMGDGGMFDQLGGGFHRYSVDQKWLIPHFEKMLYDNALLGTAYLHGWQVFDEERFEQIARQTLEWMLSEMQSPAGGFFASLDADSEGEEGKFYVWTQVEIEESLPDDLTQRLFCQAYGVSPSGNFEGTNVLHRAKSTQELAEMFNLSVEDVDSELSKAIEILNAVRSRRPRPLTDDKVIASWNGLALTFLAEASRLLDRDRYLPEAQKLASFLSRQLLSGDRLHRTWRNQHAHHPAMLEDYAAIANGLVDLYQVDFDSNWIDLAQLLIATMCALFEDPQGGFFDSPADLTDLIARPKSLQDSPTPSGNSLAIRAILRLNSLTPNPELEEKAVGALAAFQSTAARYPSAFSAWLLNLDWALGPIVQVALVGEITSPSFRALAKIRDENFHSRLIQAGEQFSESPTVSLLEGRKPINGKPTAFLCQGFSCRLPTTEPHELRRQIFETLE